MDPKIHVSGTTFGIQINNTCNMSCDNCLTFNNFNFKGVFKWETHAERYIKWGDICTFGHIAIQGGEPYLNPELNLWAKNIINIFNPDARYSICTNGTLLDKNIDLTRYLIDLGWDVVISVHHESQLEKINNDVDKILSVYQNLEIEEYKEDPDAEYSYSPNNIKKYRSNGRILVETIYWPEFFPAPQFVKDGIISFERGDAVKNHDRCMAIPCSMMMHGIYYKCSLLSTFREASKQFKFEEDALALLEEYKGCDPFDTEENIRHFFNTLNKPVPQCKLCRYYDVNPPGTKKYDLIPTNGLSPKIILRKL